MANAIAGWYDYGSGQTRWWDGKAWTTHTALDTAVGSEPLTEVGPGEPVARKRPVWPWFLGGGILTFLLLAGGGVFLALGLFGGMNGQSAPADTLKQFDKAWQTSDCGLVQSVTTAEYQKSLGFDDCATFATAAASLADSTNDYKVSVGSVKIQNNDAAVQTVETYYDVQKGENGSTSYTYDFVKSDGKWLISSVSSTG